ncbi:MAG TPA: HAMP domain-containing sensor histidine kinase [Pseudonocardiaceae bacterium]|jgi:two-component system OmpR family sensor kinase|nr:HAMP domain-containing sensor histidine kinase [Pseudonocardiaceae bacterium]
MSSSRPAERPATGWRDPAGWSLRARLLAVQILLLALVCTIIGVATQLALHSLLFNQLDTQLNTISSGAVQFESAPPGQGHSRDGLGQVGQPGQGPDFLHLPGLPINAVGVSVEPSGRLEDYGILNSYGAGGQGGEGEQRPNTSPIALSAARTLATVPTDGRTHSLGLGQLGDYQVLAATTKDGTTVVIGLPLDTINTTQTELTWVFSLVAGGGLLAAGVIGALIIRRTLRPLRRVAATAGRVAELPLDRGEVALSVRVPEIDTDPRTEVGQVGGALNRMLGHIAGALAARQASETRVRQFLADASHELRTPLAAIRGYAELARRSRDSVPADIAHALRRVESESARMTTLVEDLLLLARLDSGRPLEQEPVDLSMLVVDAVSDAHVAGPQHRWRLELPEEPVTVTGDGARLHQVLANLLTNARTHTPAGSTVTVGISASRLGEAVLTVTDDGPGIPPELLPQVFDRFARGDTSRSRAAGSTGLGLAIVAAVVAAHHGTVEVDSRPGRTAFTVRLPGANPVTSNDPADLTATTPIELPGTHSGRTGPAQPPARSRAQGGHHDRARP